MFKFKAICMCCFMLFFLTGCWDSINIEKRGFVIGTGIDLAESDGEQTIYTVTDQFVLPQSFGNSTESTNDNQAFLNITNQGSSIYKADEQTPATSSKTPYYEHLKVVIVSDKLATSSSQMNQLMDRYIRDISLRRGIKVVIAKDDAGQLLELNNPENQLPSIHLYEMLELSNKRRGFLKALTLGDIEEFHLRNRSYILPLVSAKGDKLERKEGAILQGEEEKMVGTFDEDEMQGIELYKGQARDNIIDFTYQDNVFAFNINDIKSKVKIESATLPNMKVNVHIRLFGTIKESHAEHGILSEKNLQDIQKAVSKEAEKNIKKMIDKAQNEYNADVFNVWQKLQTKHYKEWKKVRDDWEKGENYFSNNVEFNINVDSQIYTIGTSNTTQ